MKVKVRPAFVITLHWLNARDGLLSMPRDIQTSLDNSGKKQIHNPSHITNIDQSDRKTIVTDSFYNPNTSDMRYIPDTAPKDSERRSPSSVS